jgi:CheY-like chemotaxis protein
LTSTPDTRRNKIVLIVDDMPDNLNFIRTVLDAAGYLTVSAAGGPECIGVALRMTPRVILLDIEMPMINGCASMKSCGRSRSCS